MKYINHKRDGFILFHPPISHVEMVCRLGHDKADIHSAGLVKCVQGELICYGKSDSLERAARVSDTEDLKVMHDTTNFVCGA